MTIKEQCKEIGITVQDYRKWVKIALDAKAEVLVIVMEDDYIVPYTIRKREDLDWTLDVFADEGAEILAEIMI